jgi:hypothetical protein
MGASVAALAAVRSLGDFAGSFAEEQHSSTRLTRQQQGVRVVNSIQPERATEDWLLSPITQAPMLQVEVDETAQTAWMQLGNGLINRSFFLGSNLACYSIRNEWAGYEFLRSVKPESRIKIAGHWYNVGGLENVPVRNYTIADWLPTLHTAPDAFEFVGIETGRPDAWLPWTQHGRTPATSWPPLGLRVSMQYQAPASVPDLKGLQVTVNYEIYQGIPVVAKWVSFVNATGRPLTIEEMKIEELATVDEMVDRIFVESEYSFYRNVPTRWRVDPEFTMDSGPVFTERMADLALKYWSEEELDQGFHNEGPEWQGEYHSRSLMTVDSPVGPGKELQPREGWRSFKAWELFQDGRDPERKGLARKQIYRLLMPWTQENPIYMHILHADSASIRHAIDQCADCGFEMAVLTFGSGFDMLSIDPNYIRQVKADFDYAHSKKIKIGGYILFCSSANHGSPKDAPVPLPGSYGDSMCLGSYGSDAFFRQLLDFMDAVGADLIETDGPYHGFPCQATFHKYHRGLQDSYRVNWERMKYFYGECVRRGVYIISPDWYYSTGSNKTPMGYREAQWKLPRAQQLILARQNVYDGTWWRTPSMCYGACPLAPVYGSGPEATMEPLSEHLDQYDAIMAEYFGMGIQGVYRGPRLYDTATTRARVRYWTGFFHKYQDLVNADIIHIRRPDGRGLDAMMHVHPGGRSEKALAFVWNPLPLRVNREFQLPLYYTGLTESATIREQEGPAKPYKLDRDYNVHVPVSIPAGGYTWLVIAI